MNPFFVTPFHRCIMVWCFNGGLREGLRNRDNNCAQNLRNCFLVFFTLYFQNYGVLGKEFVSSLKLLLTFWKKKVSSTLNMEAVFFSEMYKTFKHNTQCDILKLYNAVIFIRTSNLMLLPPSAPQTSCCYLHQNLKLHAVTSIRTSNPMLLPSSEPQTSCSYLNQNLKPHAATSISTSNFMLLPSSELQTSCSYLNQNLKPHAVTSISTSNLMLLPPSEPQTSCCYLH
jgi:hypothetical protein